MEAIMKIYTEKERYEHIEKWKAEDLSKAAYAKSTGIHPTTFYKWTRGQENEKQCFVEVHGEKISNSIQEIVIEKDNLIIRVPVSLSIKELQSIFIAVLGV
jgi:type III secretory pathway component EscR